MRLLTVGFALASTALTAGEPQVLTVTASGKDFLIAPQITEYHTLPRDITVEVNGRAEVQTVYDKVPVTTAWPTVLDANAGDFLDRAGRPLDPRAVAKVLKAGAVLAVSTDGSAVGPEVLKSNPNITAILLIKPWDTFRPKDRAEQHPPPHPGTLFKDETGGLVVEVTITNTVSTQQTRLRRVGGRTIMEVVTVSVPQSVVVQYSLADATLTDLGGNPVVAKALRAGSKVAVSADSNPVDPRHLNELKGVVAVVVPKPVLP